MRGTVRGIPTAHSVDHVGLAVPDLDQAVDFFTRVLGCDFLYRTGPVFDWIGGDWMSRHYGVPARASLQTAMLRCGPGTNVELLAWDLPDASSVPGGRMAVGDSHLAIYVTDLQEAATYMASHPGVKILGPPTVITGEPNEGAEFLFVRLPWGMSLELIRWPTLMPYCAGTSARLVPPARDWTEHRAREEGRSES